jgi:hypothetical protein
MGQAPCADIDEGELRWPERNMIAVATAGAKLEHAFHSAIETYYCVKRGASQIIRIEKVEVQAGGNAVVGIVDHK